MDFDLDIDDLSPKTTKKKKNGCRKGKSVERQLCKLLTDFFGCPFTRSIGSGNRIHQVELSENAKQVFTGDLVCPPGFKWVFESKGGYEDDIDLATAIEGSGVSRLDEFIKQSNHDAEYCHRKPIICWKRNWHDWLAMIKSEDAIDLNKFDYRLHYREWVMVSLQKLLQNTERSFWFEL